MGSEVSVVELDATKSTCSIPGCTVQIAPSSALARSIRRSVQVQVKREGEANLSAAAAAAAVPRKTTRPRDAGEEDDVDEYRDPEDLPDDRDAKKQKIKEKPPADPEGYRFRKYGKKMIGNEARHYFRCTFPCCEVKRHVTFKDGVPEIVVLGDHGHPPPTMTRTRIVPGGVPVRIQVSPAPPPMPPPPRMMGFLPKAAPVVCATQADLINALESQMMMNQKTCSVLLSPGIDHNRDEWSWIAMGQDKFGCTIEGCNATKHATPSGGSILVEYENAHNHKRPLLVITRPDSVKRGSGGHKGSLDDVYMLLAASEDQ